MAGEARYRAADNGGPVENPLNVCDPNRESVSLGGLVVTVQTGDEFVCHF
tara:strand:- start:340 stop:489 length:150 start_codon:yes stop_codon:yes gene_type:complete